MSARLVLVRHGHVEGDFAERYLGRADPGLSDAGRGQAERLRQLEGLAGVPVWSSPSRRAIQTARIAFPEAAITPQPLAMELAFGALDGLHPREAARLFPEAVAYLASHPLDARPFGGEDWTALLARAAALRTQIEAAWSAAESQPPSAECQRPSAERREPSAERREPSAERREPSAERREPSAERREPSLVLVGHLYAMSALVAVLTDAPKSVGPVVLTLACCDTLGLVTEGARRAWTVV